MTITFRTAQAAALYASAVRSYTLLRAEQDATRVTIALPEDVLTATQRVAVWRMAQRLGAVAVR